MVYRPTVAVIGEHKGSCPGCGVWRPDGQPPNVHFHGCAMGPNGIEYGPVGGPVEQRGHSQVQPARNRGQR